ncbi:MAG: peptidylprolyl isomerase [Patescibacteria group bacterium]
MKRQITIIVAIVILIIVAWYFFDYRLGYPKDPDELSNTATSTMKNFMNKITIETNKGTIVFETYDADAPNTVKNFITLANKGFYNGLIYHRVIYGFMIQGGDPTGTGTGGPGYQFADELNPNTPSYKADYVRGTVAMANSGPNTNGSQFFIMQKDNSLPHNYTVFGRVISGIDVVDIIAAVKTSTSDKPIEDVVMKKVTVEASR